MLVKNFKIESIKVSIQVRWNGLSGLDKNEFKFMLQWWVIEIPKNDKSGDRLNSSE